MPETTRQANVVIGISLTTLFSVLIGVFAFGKKLERFENRVNASVTVTEMALWEYRAADLNKGWTPPRMMQIRAKTNGDTQQKGQDHE